MPALDAMTRPMPGGGLTILWGCWRRGHGSGFCILNDLAITALELLRRGVVRRVLILDLDVHQVTRCDI